MRSKKTLPGVTSPGVTSPPPRGYPGTSAWGRGQGERLFIALALLLAGCGKTEAPEEKKEEAPPAVVELAEATVQGIEETVTVQGTLQPAEGKSTRVAAALPGRLMSVAVREGDSVAVGQVLATLDSRPQRAATTSAAAATSAASAQVRQSQLSAQASASDQSSSVTLAQTALSTAQTETQNALQAAQTSLELAESDLKKLQAGTRPQELAQAEATLKQAEATRARAVTEVERTSYLFEKGVMAKRQSDDAKTAFAVSESAVEAQRQQVALLKEGTRIEEKQAAELRVRQGREALSQAKLTGAAKRAQAEAALKQARQGVLQVAAKRQEVQTQLATVAQKRAEESAAQVQASYMQITAPLAGIVVKRSLNPGDLADPTSPILEIADLRLLNLVASVPAGEGARLRVGMPATLALESGVTASARVLSVGQVDAQTGLLGLRLVVDNTQGKLKAGSFATAKVTVRRTPQAIVIPKASVLSKDGKSVVFTRGGDGKAHQKELQLGIETEKVAEVRQGLKAGEKVIVTGGYELADGASVKEAEKEKVEEKDSEEKK